MIRLDGSMGEGGGQILRTALALSAVTRKPFEIVNIRSRRPRPGLRPQHLEAVRAATRICSARVEGAAENSSRLVFEPDRVSAGRYRFEIRTAGSASLVLQTVYLPLVFDSDESRVEIRGGTHVPWSPCYHYLERQWARWLRKLGIIVHVRLKRAGFYPQGGGEMQARIEPTPPCAPLVGTRRGDLTGISVLSGACNLPPHIAERQAKRAVDRLERAGYEVHPVQVIRPPAHGKGSFLVIHAEFEGGACCYSALGAPGKPSEKVADEAVKQFLKFMETDAVMDEHLADQIILPLALVPGESRYTTPCVTSHLLTNIEVIRRFVPARIEIEGRQGGPGAVRVKGSGPAPGETQ